MHPDLNGHFIRQNGQQAREANSGLVADIGGTYGRLALSSPQGELTDLKKYECRDFGSLGDMIRRYRADVGENFPALESAAFSIAGAVHRSASGEGDWVHMTNLSWKISVEGLKDELGYKNVSIDNDFVAIGKSIRRLEMSHCYPLNPERAADPTGVSIVCGPGTGFGLCTVAADGTVEPSEAGHTSLFSPSNLRMNKVATAIRHLKKALEITGGKDENQAAELVAASLDSVTRLLPAYMTMTGTARGIALDSLTDLGGADYAAGKILNRDVMTGRGLRNIYRALCLIEHQSPVLGADGEKWITLQAIEGGDRLASEAVGLLWSFLGETAANLAVQAGATGGVYIAGGIAYRLLDAFRANQDWQERFMKGFKGVGPHNMSDFIPVTFVNHENPALLGLQHSLQRMPEPASRSLAQPDATSLKKGPLPA